MFTVINMIIITIVINTNRNIMKMKHITRRNLKHMKKINMNTRVKIRVIIMLKNIMNMNINMEEGNMDMIIMLLIKPN